MSATAVVDTTGPPYPEELVRGCKPGSHTTKASNGTHHGALQAGHELDAVGLVKAGAAVNEMRDHTCPLHISVECISSVVTELLLSHGAVVDACNEAGPY